ncbi:hypothetical protein GY45DRAFT_1324394 [Cubamyces sp. BRFM 1775]|nr:hypothetical protein GY45DRAFT_1324394 [Cubamyces sp. BRFM 1775]
MDYNNAAWLQAQTIPDLHTVSVHDERSVAGSNDWKDAAASVQGGGGLNDFLNDMQVSHTPTPPITQSTNPFSHLLLQTSASYNAVPYPNQWISTPPLPLSSYSSLNGATSTSSHSHIQSQGQGQSQGQSQAQGAGSMDIDPVLMMNGASSSPPPQYQQPSYLSAQSRVQYLYQQATPQSMLSINPSFIHANASQYQQQTQQPQQHGVPHSRPPHSPIQQQQSQQQQQLQQQQTTLPPYVLHSPAGMNGHYTGISPSTFYGQPQQAVAGPSSSPPAPLSQSVQTPPPSTPAASSSNVSAEQARAKLAADVRPFIQPNSFSGAGAVLQLVSILDQYGIADVDPQIRLDIVTKIRDCAGNHYFRAWVDTSVAMDIVREWLKLAFVGRNDPQLVETIMPILHIIDRLPLSLEKLKQSKLGKLIMKLTKDPPTPAIKDMAMNLEQKWRRMLQEQDGAGRQADSDKAEDLKGKKRKVDPSSKAAPPAKKAAVATPAGPSKAKAVSAKEIKPVVKDAKSDSSFFSSRTKQAKPPMPSFKKNTSASTSNAAAAPKNDPNVAQPSSINPFAEILAHFQGPSAAGPSNSTPPPAASGQPAGSTTGLAAGSSTSHTLGKRKKSVTWAPDGQLEQIKLIERAVYDDDGTTGSLPTHNIRDLDRDEGAALHNHLFEEQIEWTEPQPLQMPPEIEIPARGNESQERAAQEEREQSALVVSYASPAQIPDSPAEPPVQIPDEQVDDGVRTMLTGPEADAVFWSDGVPALVVDANRPSTSVAELVGQLAAPPMPDVANPSFAASMTPLAGINPEQLQQITLALSQGGFGALGAQPGPPPSAPMGLSHGGEQAWGGQYNEFDRGYHEPNGAGRGGEPPPGPSRRWNEDGWGDRGGHRGRGRGAPPMRGRGRGDGFRNTKRKPCSFFQAGRCRYGDQCDFSHEPLNYS